MFTFWICLIISMIAGSFYGATWFEFCVATFSLFAAANTHEILRLMKKEQITDEDSLRAIYERDRLLAALKQMQESNPGVLTFAIKSAAEIKKARAAWVNASAVVAEVEKHNVK